jgi:hypothetical protein
MPGNRVVVYQGPGQVTVENVDYPKLELPDDVTGGMGIKKEAPHAAILKVVSTNICGSDQHMVRGRTTAPEGQTLGHEITGEVVEMGDDVLFVKEGDICSVPFNIACGRCRMCNEGKTGICLNVNPSRPGAAYGYVDMGGWIGGQAEYVMVPFADFNLLKFPDRDQALAKIKDLTMLSDIFPTGYHGAYSAGVTTGSTVYVAGAGPVGTGSAASARTPGHPGTARHTPARRPHLPAAVPHTRTPSPGCLLVRPRATPGSTGRSRRGRPARPARRAASRTRPSPRRRSATGGYLGRTAGRVTASWRTPLGVSTTAVPAWPHHHPDHHAHHQHAAERCNEGEGSRPCRDQHDRDDDETCAGQHVPGLHGDSLRCCQLERRSRCARGHRRLAAGRVGRTT